MKIKNYFLLLIIILSNTSIFCQSEIPIIIGNVNVHFYKRGFTSLIHSHENEINVKDNPELMMRAVHSMYRASNDDQRSLILAVLEAQDVVTEATELSALLHRTKLNIRAIDTETLETVLTVLRNPFNEELAEKIQGETNEIDF